MYTVASPASPLTWCKHKHLLTSQLLIVGGSTNVPPWVTNVCSSKCEILQGQSFLTIVIDLSKEVQSERHICETFNFLMIMIMNCFCGMFDWWKALRGYSFSIYAKFSEKLTSLTPWYAHVRVSGVRNLSFSDDFTYVRNEWALDFVPNGNHCQKFSPLQPF